MKRLVYFIGSIAFLVFTLSSCEDGGVNFFSISQDIAFGEQMDSTILANPEEFPILDEATNPEAYEFMNNMLDDILASEYINHANDFPYKLRIIDKDVLNAFAVPGGNLYWIIAET